MRTRRGSAPERTAASALSAARLWSAWLLLAASPAVAQTPVPAPWRSEGLVDGCEVSTRAVRGSDTVAARTSCVLAADLESIARVLHDVERYPEWMQHCSQTKVLKVLDRERDVFVFWVRQHVALFGDRDMVLRNEVAVRDQDRRIIRASSTSEATYDAGARLVRMPSFASEWVLERVGDGSTRVTLVVDADLGPGLPTGIANAVLARTLPRSIRQGLTRMATRPEYVADLAATGR